MTALPSPPVPGNHHPKFNDHSHEQICISITFVKLYRTISSCMYLSSCHVLLLLNTVKLIQGDTLGEVAGTCVHPLGHVWCQPVAWAALCQLRSLPGTTYQLKHKPSFSSLPPAELTRMGAQPGSSKELMPPSLGNRSGWPPACCPSPGQGSGILHPSQEVPAELSSCCPHQQPFFFFFNWWSFFYYYFLILTRGHFLYCF